MSDTTGWKRGEQGCYWKVIYDHRFIICPEHIEGWKLSYRISKPSYHKRLSDAKRAAHALVRLWRGDPL